MAESFVQLPVDSVGKKLRTEELVVGLNTVHQEVLTIASQTGDEMEVDAAGNAQVDIAAVSTTVPISAAALPLPAGAATAAAQLPNSHDVTVDNGAAGAAVNIQDGGNSITVDGSVTANAGTNLNTSALALEAGGNLAAIAASLSVLDDWDETDRAKVNPIAGQAGVQGGSGVITALTQRVVIATDQPAIPVTGGGGTQYAEDTVAVDGDLGTFALAKRQDTPAADVTADGDRARMTVDSLNRLWTNPSSVTQPISAAALPLPAGAATSALQLPNSHDVTVDNGAGAAAVNIQDGGNAITVDGTVTADTELPPAAALSADNVASPTAPAVGSFDHVFDGTNWDRMRGDSTDGVLVNLGANNDVTVTGSTTLTPGTGASNLGKAEDAAHVSGDVGVMALATANEANTVRAADNDYVPIATDTEGNVRLVGNRDHDAGDAGEPVKVGYKAIAHGANPTAVAANDRTDAYANRHGIPWVLGGHPNIVTVRANFTAVQTDTALVTVAGGLKIVVTKCSALLDKDTTVAAVAVRIGFGAANTPTTTGVLLAHPGLAAGSGVIEGSGAGIIGIGADGEDLRITSEVPTGGSLDVIVTYFTVES